MSWALGFHIKWAIFLIVALTDWKIYITHHNVIEALIMGSLSLLHTQSNTNIMNCVILVIIEFCYFCKDLWTIQPVSAVLQCSRNAFLKPAKVCFSSKFYSVKYNKVCKTVSWYTSPLPKRNIWGTKLQIALSEST